MSHEVRFALTTLGLAAAALAIGYLPTVRLAGPGSPVSMAAGVAVSLVASWLGALPVAMSRNPASGLKTGNIVLAGMVVRFLVVLSLALLLALTAKVDRPVFLVWVGISYLILLTADTKYALSAAQNIRKEQS